MPTKHYLLACSALSLVVTIPAQDTFELNPILVNANRIYRTGSEQLNSVSSYSLLELESGQFRDVSEVVSSYPGIAAYRRTHSVAAHPTTQGLRFRNVGANATSRTLVINNGVPQNDPFGGWIYWHQFNLSQIESISIHSSGYGESWGNMASGGLISFIDRDYSPGAAQVSTSLGSSGRIELQANSAIAAGDAVIDFGIRHFETDGFHTLKAEQRGAVDRPANSKSTSFKARASWETSDTWKSQFVIRGFEEKRSNGTPLARNDTESLDLSLITEKELSSESQLNISLYFQNRDFRNVFASVDTDRNGEREALDQYKVPARSFGGAVVYRQTGDRQVSFNAGFDFRSIDGYVNERYRNLGAGFTRDRYAGGEQLYVGAFGSGTFQLGNFDQLRTTLRLDRVSQNEGVRTETDTTDNSQILDQRFADREQTIVSGNLAWNHQFSETANGELSFFSGFRAPTLNELYRPFRVRNDITESNPNLVNERQQGIDYSFTKRSESGNLLRVSIFHYEIDEMIANALLTRDSGFDPRFGFIPDGGSGSQRVNLSESKVSGLELHFSQNITPDLTAGLTATYADSEVSADELDQFVGSPFPHASPWRAVSSLDWQATEKLSLWTRYQWTDRSYEGLGKATQLGATSDLSVGGLYQIDEARSLSVAITNVLDEENVTGIASNGLITIDEPRELVVRFSWRK